MTENTAQKNPQMDWGFYAALPRIIRTGYKNLTTTDKWAYACLKDLCGETGVCFRTIRVLAEESDLSTGALSKSIRKLHTAGLIHAEKKARREDGPEVWHISIVDIWALNGKAHPTRSQGEQETVHVVNDKKTVHQVNKKGKDCSPGEQPRGKDCSPGETEEGSYLGSNSIEEGSGGDSADRSAPTPSAELQNFAPPQPRTPSAVQAPKSVLDGVNLSLKPDIPDVSPLTPEQLRRQIARRMADIMKLVDATVGVRIPRSPDTWVKQALTDMVEADWSDTVIVKAVKDLMQKKKDITYRTISDNCSAIQIRERASQPTPARASGTRTVSGYRRMGGGN